MRGLQRAGDSDADLEHLGPLHRTVRESLAERAPGHVLHDEVERTVVGEAGVEDRHTVRVTGDGAHRLTLTLELRPVVVGEVGVEHLDRDRAAEAGVLGPVDDREATTTDLDEPLVASDHRRHAGNISGFGTARPGASPTREYAIGQTDIACVDLMPLGAPQPAKVGTYPGGAMTGSATGDGGGGGAGQGTARTFRRRCSVRDRWVRIGRRARRMAAVGIGRARGRRPREARGHLVPRADGTSSATATVSATPSPVRIAPTASCRRTSSRCTRLPYGVRPLVSPGSGPPPRSRATRPPRARRR